MNYDELFKLYGFIEGFVGKNDKGENVIIVIDEESATIRTFQNNGWIRNNVYWKDGTCEESYDK